MGKIKIGENEYRLPVTIDSCEETYTCISDENCKEVSKNDMVLAINELAQLRSERDALKARVETRDALINVMAPMHQLTCRNHKTCPICKAYDKYSKEIDGESVDTTPGGDE